MKNIWNNKETINIDNNTLIELDQLKEEIIKTNISEKSDKKLESAIKEKNISKTLESLFHVIIKSIWSSPQEAFWFKNIESSDSHKLLSSTIHQLDIEQLDIYINNISQEINTLNTIHDKLLLTYIKSLCLNEKTIKSNTKQEKMNKMQLLAAQIQPWDIILVNKSEKNIADNLLLEYDTSSIDVSHAILIHDVNYNTWEININHSTGHKTTWWSGVETQVPFQNYIKQFQKLGIAIVRPPHEIINELIQNTDQKEWKKFDYWAVVKDKISKNNKNEKYNCVELIAQSLPKDKVPKYRTERTIPSDILKTFNPFYVTYTP